MLQDILKLDRNLVTLLDSIPDRVFVISKKGIFLGVFGGADTNVVYSSKKVLGMSFHDLFASDIAKEFENVVARTLNTNTTQKFIYSFEPDKFPPLPDGVHPTTTQWFESRVHPLPEQYKSQDAVIWVVRNVTDSEVLKRKLQRHATIDDLTGVMNRRSFLYSAERTLSSIDRFKEHASLLMLDIDNFKVVNDVYGHETGDEVLKGVALVFIEHVRDIDTIGRLGGEEFAIILPHSDEVAACRVADRICKELRNTSFEHLSSSLSITISIGVTAFKPNDNQIKQALKRADEALYQAKSSGKDRYVLYSDSINANE